LELEPQLGLGLELLRGPQQALEQHQGPERRVFEARSS